MKDSRHFSAFFILISIILFSSIASAQNSINSTEYFGKFEKELIPDTQQLSRLILKPVKNPASYKFEPAPGKDVAITAGNVSDLRNSGSRFVTVLLEPVNGLPSICLDLNTDATFGKNECFAMIASKNNPNDFEYTLKLPIKTVLFDAFPIFLRYRRDFTGSGLMPGDRVLMQSLLGYAIGRVEIKNRSVLAHYQFDAGDGTTSTTRGLMGIDADGDGKIKNEPFSLETSYAFDEEIVFRIGDLYLSTRRLDTIKNQIVMRSRAADEYQRVEPEIGKTLPDFSFIDFDDKKRTLAELRGKYLLVDFWGLWCIDCVREIPYQLQAYKKFRGRGFEILGMDTYDNFEKVKNFLLANKIPWTQARFESIEETVEKTYRIQQYPSSILLDPQGKVIILDQNLLRGEQLLKTLEKILPS